MRALRKDGADYETAVESMPRTIAAYITPTREAATGIMATFEALWRDIKKLMGQKSRAWTIANFSKKELRRAVESASYAAGTYPRIEKKGGDSSLLVFALNLGKVLAAKHKDEEGNPAPLDPRSEEHTSELQSLMRISYAVFCLKTKHTNHKT